MIEIIISQEWKEEFEHMEQALFYVNALLELIRRQSAEPYPEQFNSLEEFKNYSKLLLGENTQVHYYESEYLFNVLLKEGISFECDEEAIYINKVRISDKHVIRQFSNKFNSELIYENKIVNKKEIEQLIGKRLSKYKIIKL